MNCTCKNLESRLRYALHKAGLALVKSRVRNTSCDDWGGYRIVNPYFNRVEWGECFELSLEDVQAIAEALT